MMRRLRARIGVGLVLGATLAIGHCTLHGSSALAAMDVVMVLDHSGSMRQNDPQRLLIQAASDFVRKLASEDAAGLVVFGAQAKAAHLLGPLADEGRQKDLLEAIARIRYADPRTNMAAGIERGMYELKQHGRTEAMPILIFLTDGIMDTGSKARDAEMREWLRTRLLPGAREARIRIFSVALTEEADYALIQEMASVTGGDYYRAINAREIAGIFHRIRAGFRQAPVAPSPPLPAPSAPSVPPAAPSILVLSWPWIAVGAGFTILLVAVLIMSRRLRLARAQLSQASPSSTVPPTVPRVRLDGRLPPAQLRDMRTGKSTQLTKPLTRIGRAPDNDLVIPELQVSAHHAEIEYRQGHFFLRDLRSTNGTWVNAERIFSETMLRSGDVLRFDEFSFTFSEQKVGADGTIMREFDEGTVVSEAVRPRAAASPLAGTAIAVTEETVDDSTGPPRCPAHANFEATERCERCGELWCALCNPPVPGSRVCRKCKEAEKGPAKPPAPQPGGSASRR